MKYLLISLIIAITAIIWFRPEISDGKPMPLTENLQFQLVEEEEISYEEGPMWKLSYSCPYRLEDWANVSAVEKEVISIWQHYFRQRVEQKGYLLAMIQARERREGFGLFLDRPVRNFIFKRQSGISDWILVYGEVIDGQIMQKTKSL
ncbi:MAG: hypothetical protein AAGA18_00635 [Verrucomicrobiota bacterium]